MIAVYECMRNYHAEMDIVNKLFPLEKNDPAILIQKGILFEKMNRIDSAKTTYFLANKIYREKLAGDPGNIDLISDIILLKAIADGKDAAIKERDEEMQKYPQLASKLNAQTYYLEDFDRNSFLHLDKKGN
jgi:hypothetical protein